MEMYRTDLAMEARNAYRAEHGNEADGVAVEEEDLPVGHVTRLEVLDARGEDRLGKPVGRYTTLEISPEARHTPQGREDLSDWVAGELSRMAPDPGYDAPSLIVGLGNGGITPDSLGPRTVRGVLVTRHVMGYLRSTGEERLRPVCAISPGVLGMTGIQTADILTGVVGNLHPACLITVDALASRSVQHIASTVQISNAGVRPGSGLGNRTVNVDREHLGVPVLSLGIPTVVYAAVIARDALRLAFEGEEDAPPARAMENWVRDRVEPAFGDLVVTPKDVDVLVEDMAHVLSMGINLWAHPALSREEIVQYLH